MASDPSASPSFLAYNLHRHQSNCFLLMACNLYNNFVSSTNEPISRRLLINADSNLFRNLPIMGSAHFKSIFNIHKKLFRTHSTIEQFSA